LDPYKEINFLHHEQISLCKVLLSSSELILVSKPHYASVLLTSLLYEHRVWMGQNGIYPQIASAVQCLLLSIIFLILRFFCPPDIPALSRVWTAESDMPQKMQ